MEKDLMYICPKCGYAMDIMTLEQDVVIKKTKAENKTKCAYCQTEMVETKYAYDEYLDDILFNHSNAIFEEYVYNSPLYDADVQKDRKQQESENLAKIDREWREKRAIKANAPKCPVCGSDNLSKITLAHKAGKIALFGVFGMGDNGKTWKCNNCGSKF